MSPLVPVRLRVPAGFREPENPRNVEVFVLRVFAPGNSTLRHADLEVPPLLAKELDPLRPLAGRVLRGAGTVFACRIGHLRDARRRRCCRQLHLVGPDVSRELVMILGMDEIIQGLTQQLVLQQHIDGPAFIFDPIRRVFVSTLRLLAQRCLISVAR